MLCFWRTNGDVQVSSWCCNKLTQCLTTAQIYLTALEVLSLKPVGLGSSQGVGNTVSFEGSRGESISLTFPATRGRLYCLAHGPFLHLQSHPCSIFSVIILTSSPYNPLASCDCIGPIGDAPWSSSQTKTVNLIISIMFLFPYNTHRFQRLDIDIFVNHYSTYHRGVKTEAEFHRV